MIPFIIGACYVPFAASRNLQEDDINSAFTKPAVHLATARAEEHVLLGGDFNARVGRLESLACVLQRKHCWANSGRQTAPEINMASFPSAFVSSWIEMLLPELMLPSTHNVTFWRLWNWFLFCVMLAR